MRNLRNNSVELIEKLGFKYNPNLPFLEEIGPIKTSAQVLNRINILNILYTIGNENNPKCTEFFKDMLSSNDWRKHLTPHERTIIYGDSFSDQSLLDLTWKKEAMFALLWAVKLNVDDIFEIREIFVSSYFECLPPDKPWKEFVAWTSIRSKLELAQVLDFYYCLHSSLKHRDKGSMSREQSIVTERRRALEWIVDKTIQWDEISLDT